jgi:hypothetical protein
LVLGDLDGDRWQVEHLSSFHTNLGCVGQTRTAPSTRTRLMFDRLKRIGDLRQRRPGMTFLPTALTSTPTPQRLRRRLRQPIRRRWLRRIPRIHSQLPLQLSNLSLKLTDQRVFLGVPRYQSND